MYRRIDLREQSIKECQGCNRNELDDVDQDGLCLNVASVLDGLPLRCVGHWAYDKIYRLVQYFGIFVGGMKNSWTGLNYVEICSGPGRCVDRDNRSEMDGTAIAIMRHQHFPKLSKALFLDASERVVGILNQRIEALGKGRIARAVVGDYQDADGICAILNDLPPKCLNLVFIDPTECNVPFSTIERIVQHLKKADLIINVAIGTDVNRNLVQAITSPAFATVRTKYEEFLGVPDFCSRPEIRELAERADYDDLRRAFAECYRQQLQKLGYHYTDSKPVKHYYHLVFASKDPKGLDFWQKACSIDPHNQRQLL